VCEVSEAFKRNKRETNKKYLEYHKTNSEQQS
jgi:hypothetical protein